ncbi:MAG: Glu/Leu/Phe/Val dehydrogenase [Nitrososphaerota archaeon]|nr:Glu/Leu/Phe/Val dehydrogenase [Nitrososphaerota archaeon]
MQRVPKLEELLQKVNVAALADQWGPEKAVQVYNPTTGMEGCLVIDNTARGPGEGGVRIDPELTPAELFRLARTMTWKCALADLPFGGARACISANPEAIDRRKYVKSFAQAVSPLVPSQWVASPDTNMDDKDMEVFVEEIGDLRGAAGKPERMGGIPQEPGAIGYGIGIAIEAALEALGNVVPTRKQISGMKVAMHGCGSTGTELARFLAKEDFKIVSISDYRSAIVDPKGIDISGELICEGAGGQERPKPRAHSAGLQGADPLCVDCDILVVGTKGRAITEDDAGRIRAKLVVEAEDHAVGMVEEALFKRGIVVVPDLLANGGGPIAAYVEYAGGNADRAFAMIESKTRENTERVLEGSVKNERMVLPRTVATRIAMDRVREAMRGPVNVLKPRGGET